MRKRRLSFSVYAIIIVSILLSVFYESFQPRNIETVTIISGVGIDEGENNSIKLSIQMIKPEKGDAGSSTSSCIVVSAEGRNVAEAADNIVLKTGSVLFWAHCSAIIIRDSVARGQDIVPLLDMFFRSSNFRNTASIIICEEAPEEILNSNTIFEMVSAFGIQRLLEDQNNESSSVFMSLKKYYRNYYSKSSSAVLAGITTTEVKQYSGGSNSSGSDSDKPTKTIVLSNCAVTKSGRLVDYINENELNGYKWFSNTMKTVNVTIDNVEMKSEDNGKNTFGLTLFGTKCTLTPIYENGKYILHLRVTAKAEIVSIENALESHNISRYRLEKRFDELEKIISDKIKSDMTSAWSKMIETNADFCGIQNIMYGKFGNDWPKNDFASDSAMLSQIELDYSFDIQLMTSGFNKRFRL